MRILFNARKLNKVDQHENLQGQREQHDVQDSCFKP